ncbi:MAG: superoxide dismutase [Clostridiales bacterium]|nr:superoxide dismutase [Clostridiales bacterium]
MNRTYPFVPIKLPFKANQLSPYIDARTIMVHYNLLYKNYILKLNEELSKHKSLQDLTLEQLLSNPSKLPEKDRVNIMRYAGGVFNHEMYFMSMGMRGDTLPNAKLRSKINNCFGSFNDFKERFIAAGLAVFGSGYAWLVVDKKDNLMIIITANQETPLEHGLKPIMCCDVWEHAYFLQYLNRRADYLNKFFKIINWNSVEKNLM